MSRPETSTPQASGQQGFSQQGFSQQGFSQQGFSQQGSRPLMSRLLIARLRMSRLSIPGIPIPRLLLLFPLLFAMNVFAAPSTNLIVSLMDESRPAEDKARDGGRKPAEVMDFLGVKRGMTALDVIAAGGYYTEVLSRAVGSGGKVYAQNPAFVLEFRDGANDKALAARLRDHRLPNVVRWDRETSDLGIAPNSVDIAITALNFHDIYNSSGKAAAVSLAKFVFDVLKPGGVFGVIDHEGAPAADNTALHRMQSGLALEALLEAGFSIEATSNALRNPEDDLTKVVFSRDIRGKTDRFLIKAVKPR